MAETSDKTSLTEQQKKCLRGFGHRLKPIIIVGNSGLTKSLLEEFDRSLAHHELMKVKVSGADRETRDDVIQTLCRHAQAELIQRVGNVGLLFKKKPKKSKFAAL